MQNINWGELGFEFMQTRSNIRFHYADGKWGEAELTGNFNITVSVAANAFHYGQAAFEGGKAFQTADGRICIFRPDENGKRLNSSARRLMMPEFPVERFVEAVQQVVADNADFVPPYGTGGALYIRPVMFGVSPTIGVSPSKEYELVIMVMPVGPYYKGGIKPVDAMVSRDFDRAAPRGTGMIKAAGNYAASLLPSKLAKEKHCPIALFLDPATRTYIDEWSTSNFCAVSKEGHYVTPKSDSILPSITNKSIRTVATDLGIVVEERPVLVEELADFAEVGALGTAVVITPVGRIFDGDKVYDYHQTEIGPVLKRLYDEMTGIQKGVRPDKHNWLVEVNVKGTSY